MSDIIADIDALIDDQLEAGEPETGFDYGMPTSTPTSPTEPKHRNHHRKQPTSPHLVRQMA